MMDNRCALPMTKPSRFREAPLQWLSHRHLSSADYSTNRRLFCKVKTWAYLVGHRLALMADNPESLKPRGYA